MEQSAVEWFAKELYEKFEMKGDGKVFDELLNQAIEIEEKNLIDMSVKSALYERKWLYEEMSDKKYKPAKFEIRDLKITALEHYNETFKSE